MSIRKLRHALDSLDLKIQQLGVDLHSLHLIRKRKFNVTISQMKRAKIMHETSEVNFDLAPRFE